MVYFYFEISDDLVDNWPGKYLKSKGYINDNGRVVLNSIKAYSAFDQSPYVLIWRDGFNPYYIKAPIIKKSNLIIEDLVYFKLASIEI